MKTERVLVYIGLLLIILASCFIARAFLEESSVKKEYNLGPVHRSQVIFFNNLK